MAYLNENKKYNVRKTLLASIIALCDKDNDEQVKLCDEYRIQMMRDIDNYNKEMKNQEKSVAQKKNWLSQEQILDVYKSLHNEILQLKLWSRSPLNKKEYDLLQSYVILSLYILTPPRRIMDYVNFIHITGGEQEMKNTHLNYLDSKKSELVFNAYKTKDTYKQQRVKIDKKLKSIIQRWVKKKKELGVGSGSTPMYMFTRNDGRPYTQPEFTGIIQKIFRDRTGKSVSVNILRHAFISDVLLKDMPKLNEIQEEAEKMGTSVNHAINTYKKVD
jgi:hypothetical protein